MVAAVVGEGRKGGVTGLGGAKAQREGEDGKQAVQDRKGSRGAGRLPWVVPFHVHFHVPHPHRRMRPAVTPPTPSIGPRAGRGKGGDGKGGKWAGRGGVRWCGERSDWQR